MFAQRRTERSCGAGDLVDAATTAAIAGLAYQRDAPLFDRRSSAAPERVDSTKW
jgi:hypothetical protein